MKKYIFLVVALLCALLPATLMAEELKSSDANIVGHVLEKHSKEHLSYITVSLKGTTIGTLTDATGHYFLKNLPEGRFTLQVSSVGYKTLTREVVLKKGVTLEENFELEEDLVALWTAWWSPPTAVRRPDAWPPRWSTSWTSSSSNRPTLPHWLRD